VGREGAEIPRAPKHVWPPTNRRCHTMNATHLPMFLVSRSSRSCRWRDWKFATGTLLFLSFQWKDEGNVWWVEKVMRCRATCVECGVTCRLVFRINLCTAMEILRVPCTHVRCFMWLSEMLWAQHYSTGMYNTRRFQELDLTSIKAIGREGEDALGWAGGRPSRKSGRKTHDLFFIDHL